MVGTPRRGVIRRSDASGDATLLTMNDDHGHLVCQGKVSASPPMNTPIAFGRDLLSKLAKDDVLTLAASLAFYTALSLSPLVLILLSVVGLAGAEFKQALVANLISIVGPQAAAAVQQVVDSAESSSSMQTAGWAGAATLAISSAAVFGQLQHALNIIWRAPPPSRSHFLQWIRKRLLSIGLVLSLGFVILVSLLGSALLAALLTKLDSGALLGVVDFCASFLMIGGLFSLIFYYLPDVRLRFEDVRLAAGCTTLLFLVGKQAIALYLAESSFDSSYGAAGSFVALLLWVYYSSLIVLVGAAATERWRAHRNHRSQSPK